MLDPEMLILFFKVNDSNCNNGFCKQHKSNKIFTQVSHNTAFLKISDTKLGLRNLIMNLKYGLKIIYVERSDGQE